ncbi:hypothetical protein QVD17_06362 [Tagetes erecta]|uniref:Uncharacterized protein n=1 Tax=Tagetes erecta TaxID=13708 RepID=A0AAD8LE14_TARER|nr:hypothetical protein QVD17_06362 [Tagetes erecta]
MRKNVRGLSSSLKQCDNFSGGGSLVLVDSGDHRLAAVIPAFIGVSEMTVLVFESLLMFFSGSVSKPNRWSIVVSKIMHKESGSVNEFESIDTALRMLCKYGFSSEMGNVEIARCNDGYILQLLTWPLEPRLLLNSGKSSSKLVVNKLLPRNRILAHSSNSQRPYDPTSRRMRDRAWNLLRSQVLIMT